MNQKAALLNFKALKNYNNRCHLLAKIDKHIEKLDNIFLIWLRASKSYQDNQNLKGQLPEEAQILPKTLPTTSTEAFADLQIPQAANRKAEQKTAARGMIN